MRATARSTALLCLLSAAALAACAPNRVAYSAAKASADPEPLQVKGSYDRVWKAVVQELFERNVPIRTIDEKSGIVESGGIAGEVGKDCDCGRYLGIPIGGYAGGYGGDAVISYRILVTEEGESTRIAIRSRCEGRAQGVDGTLVCQTDPKKIESLRDGILSRAR